MKIFEKSIFCSLGKTYVILFGMILLVGCSSTRQSSPAPVSTPATETKEKVYDDPTNIMSGEFARVLAKVEGRELDPRDPDHVRADGLDDLEVNASAPDGLTIQTAVVIPDRGLVAPAEDGDPLDPESSSRSAPCYAQYPDAAQRGQVV